MFINDKKQQTTKLIQLNTIRFFLHVLMIFDKVVTFDWITFHALTVYDDLGLKPDLFVTRR